MNPKDRMIIEDYRKSKSSFLELGDIVHNLLRTLADQAHIQILGVEHRVKSEDSLAGKLAKKGDFYQSLDDLTDILGARVITFFADDVDKIGKLVEQTFVIDWDRSSDKRALIKADTFGYLSLHYICSLRPEDGYSEELSRKRFEIQIRTILQHTWAAINHDLGYKSEFGVPRAIARELSRVAGLLEIADDQFVRVRDNMQFYTEDIRQKITADKADDFLIDIVSLREYVQRNRKMQAFLRELANISGAEIRFIDPESYIDQLAWLGKNTLGDLGQLLEENHDLALTLAEQALRSAELDILSSNVGLRFLCRAELLTRRYTEAQAAEFLKLATGSEKRAARQARALMAFAEKGGRV